MIFHLHQLGRAIRDISFRRRATAHADGGEDAGRTTQEPQVRCISVYSVYSDS